MSLVDTERILRELNVDTGRLGDGDLAVRSPVDGGVIGKVESDSAGSAAATIANAYGAFATWRNVPPPRRGELIRLFGECLRAHKSALGALVTLETGKIAEEGRGEVQEMIDICDFAVGLSRQLYGLTIATERPGHRMMETWHPLGVVGVITAFNFPVAVFAWNAALAIVCGDAVVWKPSERTPITALACLRLFEQAAAQFGDARSGLLNVVVGDRTLGEAMADDRRVALVSATGSCRMGRELAPRVAGRFGRVLLELGGNNAMIVAPTADLDMAVRAILFAAVATAGQRCTSLRRLIVHEDVYDALMGRLRAAYADIAVGDPRDPANLVGPLIDAGAFTAMQRALSAAREDGGRVHGGERTAPGRWPDAYYVTPAIVEMAGPTGLVREETFAPILYALKYRSLEQAIAIHNDVPQGLASSIFTTDLRRGGALHGGGW